MFVPILMSCVLGHVLADFIFQSGQVAIGKKELKVKFLLKHLFLVFISTFLILTLKVNYRDAIFMATIISVIHILVDIIKSIIENKTHPRVHITFLIDQLVHIVTIVIIVFIFVKNMTQSDYHVDFILWVTKLFTIGDSLKPTTEMINEYIKLLTLIEIYVSLLLFFSIGCGIFVGKFLKNLKDDSIGETTFKLGRYIGIIERLIILILAANLQFRAIALIIAAKSLARHDNLNRQHFAEYYLLGTLLNIFIGITGGLLILYLSNLL